MKVCRIPYEKSDIPGGSLLHGGGFTLRHNRILYFRVIGSILDADGKAGISISGSVDGMSCQVKTLLSWADSSEKKQHSLSRDLTELS